MGKKKCNEKNHILQITLDKRVIAMVDNAVEVVNTSFSKEIGGHKETRSTFIQKVLIGFFSDEEPQANKEELN